MSSIPSTPNSNRNGREYTVVGTVPANAGRGTAILVLNRGPRLHRRDAIQALLDDGWDEIMWVEPQENAYSVESLAREFVGVRFLLMNGDESVGTHINCAMAELNAAFVLVVWSTVRVAVPGARVIDRCLESQDLCTVPVLRTDRGEAIPTVVAPALQRRTLRVLTLPPRADGVETLFPFDYVGLYNRKRYLQIGGFSSRIVNHFWQKMDFGFRAHLWGERMRLNTALRATYRSLPEPEDQTADESYLPFYARNLAVRVVDGSALVRRRGALSFGLRAGVSFVQAWREFSDARTWVQHNAARFKGDPRRLVREWDVERDQ